DRHLVLAAVRLDVTKKGGQRRVDREADSGLASSLPEASGEVPVHPEPIAEVDLARVIAPLDRLLHGCLWALARRQPPGADTKDGHVSMIERSTTSGWTLPFATRDSRN